MNKYFKLLIFPFLIASFVLCASSKMYIDPINLDSSDCAFRVHMGGNEWIETNCIHRDETGFYSLTEDLIHRKDCRSNYEKTWKCPYCYQFWPIGKACQNKDCPSKYR